MVVCLCVCVHVDCYSCSRINEVQVRVSSHVFLDFYSWISKIMLRSRVMPSSLFRRVRSKNFSPNVATLYLVVSSVLER